MKKMNLLVMSLVSAAALSFTSCSDSEDLANDKAGQAKVDGFYMTLNVQTPKSDGTRTVVNNPTDATAEESDVTSGTIYLVDATGKVVFTKNITESDWKAGKPTQGNDGSTQIKIEVDKVVAGQTYKVYFLANADSEDPLNSTFSTTATTDNKFVGNYAKANNFAMFNQNDTQVDGNGYTVTFIKANNNEANPAKVNYKTIPNAPIKIERVVARIDAPTTSKSTVLAEAPADASAALKVAMKDAKEKVAEIKLLNYAVSNLANKSYVMQTWNSSDLVIPNDKEGFSYIQPTAAFGGNYDYKDGGFTTTEATKVNYVFENNSTTAPTTMYFEYQIKLDNSKFTGPADFKDGTFYRYNNVIYTSFAQIFEDYKDVTNLFAEGKKAGTMKAELEDAKKVETGQEVKDVETKLSEFRQKYHIEVFNEGKTYYKYVIKDNHIGYANAIQRNSIYRLNINNIFNVGAQVPNGTPTENDYYYLNVTVTVNPWVLNEDNVDLQ